MIIVVQNVWFMKRLRLLVVHQMKIIQRYKHKTIYSIPVKKQPQRRSAGDTRASLPPSKKKLQPSFRVVGQPSDKANVYLYEPNAQSSFQT